MELLKNRRSYYVAVIGVLFFAFAIRLFAALYWQSLLDSTQTQFRFGDSDTYWVLAEKIASGQPYEYGGQDSRAFRAPGYPLFLATVVYFGGDAAVLYARVAGAVLGTLTIGLLMLATGDLMKRGIASEQSARIASLCCGMMASLYLGAIGMSIFILSEAVFCPLMVLSVIAWNRSETQFNVKQQYLWSALAGGATGAACLCRPSWLLWPGLMVAMSVFQWYRQCNRTLETPASNKQPHFIRLATSVAIFAIGSGIVMTPWWIRNYIVFQSFVPTTLQVGASLYDGLHDGASGASDEGMSFTLETENALREFDRQWHLRHDRKTLDSSYHSSPQDIAKNFASDSDASLDSSKQVALEPSWLAKEIGDLDSETLTPFEVRLNKILFRRAIAWVAENPYATARLALVKFVKMWTPWPTAKEVGGRGVQAAEAIGYLVIVGFAVFGFYWMNSQMRYSAVIYASPILYFAGLHTIFVGSVRYRQPAILVLTIVSGIGAAWMLDQIERKRKRLI